MTTFTHRGYRVVVEHGVATVHAPGGRVVHTSRGVSASRSDAQARESARHWVNGHAGRERRRDGRAEIARRREVAAKQKRDNLGRFGG
jgi:hypothetical protein